MLPFLAHVIFRIEDRMLDRAGTVHAWWTWAPVRDERLLLGGQSLAPFAAVFTFATKHVGFVVAL